MRWQLLDIRADGACKPDAAGGQDDHYSTCGFWPASKSAERINIVNATVSDINVSHAPCTINAIGGMGAIIARGACGTVDGAPASPWVRRLDECLSAMLQCSEPVVGVIDAPSSMHIHAAVAHVEWQQVSLGVVADSPSKYLILESGSNPSYLSAHELLRGQPVLRTYGKDMLTCLQSVTLGRNGMCIWDQCIETRPLESLRRMEVPLAHLWGTYEKCCVQRQLHFSYPEGASVPDVTMPFVQYGDDINASSARISRTRGISALASARDGANVTIIAQFDDDAVHEDSTVAMLRRMMTSSEPEAIGSAYFALRDRAPKEGRLAAIVHKALRHIDREHPGPSHIVQPPLGRQVSFAGVADHSGWR